MKNIIAIVALLISTQTFAQSGESADKWGSDSLKCRQDFSIYNENLKQQLYNEAYMYWHKVMANCPANAESLYENGIFLTNYLMDKANDDRKKRLIDTAIWVYKTKEKYFDVDNKWKAKHGTFLMSEKKDYNGTYKVLKPVIDNWNENITEFFYIYAYSQALVYRFAKSKDKEEQDARRLEGINYYETLNKRLDQALANGANENGVAKIREVVDKHFLKFANSCESVLPVLEKKLGELPEDETKKLESVKKYMDILEKIECEGTDLYGQMLAILIELDPSAEAAYRAGNFNRERNKYSEAQKYYKQAVELCGDCEEINKYKMGVVYVYFAKGAYKTIYSYAKGIGGKYRGEALKYVAKSIAQTSQSCGDTYFHRNLNYCLAVDYLDKAAANGASVSSLKAQYKAKFPTTSEAFDLGIEEGSTQPCSCWGESTKFRAR